MQTVEETRRERLRMLVQQSGGMSNLCQRLGLARNENSSLSRILNANVRRERGIEKPFVMGSAMAREIEQKLALAEGWMDTPPSYAELNGDDNPRAKADALLAAMEPEKLYTALRLLDALAQPGPPARNGTN